MTTGKLRRAIGAVKDRASIGLAKVSNSTTVSDVEVAIVKATRHDELRPAEERHVREILSLTFHSRAHVGACVAILSRRLGKTRSWAVALKSLVLLHRLLTEGDPAYEQEIFFATRRGTRLLNMADFRDRSCSDSSWDFSAFVRTYARYVDEKLNRRMQGKSRAIKWQTPAKLFEQDEEEDHIEVGTPSKASLKAATPARDMTTERLLDRAQLLQQLLERFLACRPTGAAKTNRIVLLALYPLVKESFQLYFDLQEVLDIFVDRFADMEITESVKVHDLFSRLSKQLDGLRAFYSWCESATICRPADFPDVENITSRKLQLMDDFIRNRSSSTARSPSLLSSAANPDVVDHFSAIRALPAPDQPEHDEHNPPIHPTTALIPIGEEEANFINLTTNAVSANDHGDELAHALFGGDLSQPWDAFGYAENGSSPADWETALLQSANSLSLQKPSPGGGMDMLLLNSLYSQPNLAPAACIGGCSSSVAMLSWPEPALGSGVVDPFSASLAVAPPAYVQMWEMEKKQRLLVEEQMAWQQYAEGMQGKKPMANLWHGQGF